MNMTGRNSISRRRGSRRGQVLAEYAITLAMMAFVAILLMSLVYFLNRQGSRMIESVSIEYP